jgi:hypothetical protein
MIGKRYNELNKTILTLTINLSPSSLNMFVWPREYSITLPPLKLFRLVMMPIFYSNEYRLTIGGVWPIGINYLDLENGDWNILIAEKPPSTLWLITIEDYRNKPLKMNTYLKYILVNTEIKVRFTKNGRTYLDESMEQIEKDIMIKKQKIYCIIFKNSKLSKELIINISKYLDYKRFSRPEPRRRAYGI